VNIPLPVNAGNDSYKKVFEEIVEPLAKEFRPESSSATAVPTRISTTA